MAVLEVVVVAVLDVVVVIVVEVVMLEVEDTNTRLKIMTKTRVKRS